MPEVKCCWRCGRWGTKQYRQVTITPAPQWEWVCTNSGACLRRCHERVARLPYIDLCVPITRTHRKRSPWFSLRTLVPNPTYL